MKLPQTLLAIAAIGSVFYLGFSINNGVRLADRKLDVVLAESAKWHGEADRLNKRIDDLPQTVQGAVRAGARQGTKELVGAPAEAGKTVVKNVENTGEKGYKDTIRQVERTFGIRF